MDSAEKELLIIKRDSVLQKKNLFDLIQKNRLSTLDGSSILIRCWDVTDALNIHDWTPFESMLNTLASTGAFNYSISGDSVTGSPWGDDLVHFNLTEKFDEIYKTLREKYQSLILQITEDKKMVTKINTNHVLLEEKDLIKLIKSKIQAVDENLLKPEELEDVKQKTETFLDKKLQGDSLLSLRYRKFRAQRRTLWVNSNGFAVDGKKYIQPYFDFFEQYISEVRIRQRLSDEELWVESVTQGNEQHIIVGERKNKKGDKVHIIVGETGEIRIDGKDKAPGDLLRKAESVLTTRDGKKIKTTLEFFEAQE